MKYFTPELWAALQGEGEGGRKALKEWDRRGSRYLRQFQRIAPRLSVRAARFFTHHSLHDGALLHACVGDEFSKGIGPPERADTAVRMAVVIADSRRARRYDLSYRDVKEFNIQTDDSLFPLPNSVFASWGYDELLPEGKKYLRHQILFSSGTEISIVFGRFSFNIRETKRR
jgi:hypothetical protein